MTGVDSSRTVQDADPRWFVLHTRSRQEVILSNELRSMGVSHCLLMVGQTRRFGTCDAAVMVPLLPQYVFLRGSALDAQFAARTSRVRDLQEVTDAALLSRELASITRAVSAGAPCELAPLPDATSPARIRQGPLKGVTGFLHRGKTGCRIVLPLTCIGRGIAVDVDSACVEVHSC